jgi:mitogen-activated protein kinase organizer 1
MSLATSLTNSFLWDVTTGKTLRRFLGHTHRVNAVSFNADASILASGSYDASVRLWDCKYWPSCVL